MLNEVCNSFFKATFFSFPLVILIYLPINFIDNVFIGVSTSECKLMIHTIPMYFYQILVFFNIPYLLFFETAYKTIDNGLQVSPLEAFMLELRFAVRCHGTTKPVRLIPSDDSPKDSLQDSLMQMDIFPRKQEPTPASGRLTGWTPPDLDLPGKNSKH